ncbi:MAG: protein-tyrosine kinase [Parabacteroides sp.]|nr:protein-tyrosine kinase [Massilibacteroides sp.]MDD3509596.1 protein-tyrosine kinase [Parabacteroides sp.]MDD4116276.1 protein-tyrosine kinase [Massilibacteroides sp.]
MFNYQTINEMNITSIKIEEGRVTIRPVAGNVWLTQHEIADLFGVFISAIGSNIRSILKNEILQEDMVCRHRDNGNGSILTLYNLEMITALAFRLKSRRAQYYREWIISQALNPVILWKIPGMDAMLN